MWLWLRQLIDEKLIRPFRETKAPAEEVALGSFVGLLWALTPLVGIQMPLVVLSWALLRLFSIRFSLTIAFAWVWVSNPLTVAFFYYTFYIAGYYIFVGLGANIYLISFDLFRSVLQAAIQMELLKGIGYWTRFMIFDLGWPMMVGGMALGIPVSIASYPLTIWLINRHRTRVARKRGLTLVEWEALYVRRSRERSETQRRLASRYEGQQQTRNSNQPSDSTGSEASDGSSDDRFSSRQAS